MESLLNVDEAAKRLRISPYTLRSWVYQRRIIPVKLGRRTLFTEGELQRFVDRGKDEGVKQHYRSRAN